MNFPHHVAVFGPGLMGASLCLAVRKLFPKTRISVWARNRDRLDSALSRGLADTATLRPEEAVQNADLVVLCVPVEAMPDLVGEFIERISKKTVITDVGSVKANLNRSLSSIIGKRARWIGSHPMTGSESAGMDAARDDLYQGATTIVTPTAETDRTALDQVTHFWEALGSTVIRMTPEEHDLNVAAISHLPHLLAACLINATPEDAFRVMGPGFRDTTRIASGSPSLWTGILKENRPAVLHSIQRFIDEWGAVRDVLRDGDDDALHALLSRAADSRQRHMTETAKSKTSALKSIFR